MSLLVEACIRLELFNLKILLGFSSSLINLKKEDKKITLSDNEYWLKEI